MGRFCLVYVGVTLKSTATKTYSSYKIASGLPKPSGKRFVPASVSIDDISDEPCFSIDTSGNLTLDVRVTALNGRRIYGNIVYSNLSVKKYNL